MSNGSVGMSIIIIGRVIMIWDEVFFKLRVSFDGLLRIKKVLSEYIHRIETHLDVVVEVLEVQSSVTFGLCIDDEFMEFR